MAKPGSGWHRLHANTPANQARRKQYNSREHRERKAAGQRQVDAGHAHCWRCGRWLPPSQPWHLGHDDNDRTIYRGPECVDCNIKAAARKGARIANTRRQGHPPPATGQRWRSGNW